MSWEDTLKSGSRPDMMPYYTAVHNIITNLEKNIKEYAWDSYVFPQVLIDSHYELFAKYIEEYVKVLEENRGKLPRKSEFMINNMIGLLNGMARQFK